MMRPDKISPTLKALTVVTSVALSGCEKLPFAGKSFEVQKYAEANSYEIISGQILTLEAEISAIENDMKGKIYPEFDYLFEKVQEKRKKLEFWKKIKEVKKID